MQVIKEKTTSDPDMKKEEETSCVILKLLKYVNKLYLID